MQEEAARGAGSSRLFPGREAYCILGSTGSTETSVSGANKRDAEAGTNVAADNRIGLLPLFSKLVGYGTENSFGFATEASFSGYNEWGEVPALSVTRPKVRALLLSFMFAKGGGGGLITVAGSIEIGDTHINDTVLASREKIPQEAVATFKGVALDWLVSGVGAGSRCVIRPGGPGVDHGLFTHCILATCHRVDGKEVITDGVVAPSNEATLLAGHGMFDGEWGITTVTSGGEGRGSNAVSVSKAVLEFQGGQGGVVEWGWSEREPLPGGGGPEQLLGSLGVRVMADCIERSLSVLVNFCEVLRSGCSHGIAVLGKGEGGIGVTKGGDDLSCH